MQTLRLAVLTLVLLALASLTAHAQNVLAPGASVTVAWDAPASDATTAPTGYRLETFRAATPTVVLTTVEVAATVTKTTVPSASLPTDGEFLLSVRAFNLAGVSGRSNALPFVRAGAPGVPTNLRLDVP